MPVLEICRACRERLLRCSTASSSPTNATST